MKLKERDKELIQKYGPKYLSQNDVQTFLDMVYSHAGTAIMDVYSRVKEWLTVCNVEVPDKPPAFICDGEEYNRCNPFHKSDIIFVQGLTKIPDACFQHAVQLKDFPSIPDYVKQVGEYSFATSNIESIDLNQVEDVGRRAFVQCTHLKSVKMGRVSLGENCFYGCKELTNLTIEAMTNRISKSLYLFNECPKLEQIHTSDKKLTNYLNKYYPEIEVIR